jgi:hypothetical protein
MMEISAHCGPLAFDGFNKIERAEMVVLSTSIPLYLISAFRHRNCVSAREEIP